MLLLAASNRRRGAEVFTVRLRDGLSDRGWEIDSVCLAAVSESATTDLHPLASIEPSQVGRLRVSLVRALRSRIRSFRPDVLLANGGPTLRYAVMAKVGLNLRLAYVGIGEPEYWIRSSWSRAINRALLRRTDYILAVSDRTRQQLAHLVPSLENRIAVAHTGVPDQYFDLEHGLADGPLRVVVVGSLSHEKDPLTALQAIASVPGSIARFVGAGPLEDRLRTEAESLVDSGRIEFTGAVEDIRPHLQWAHVLLLTSLTEGLPGVILEAGAAGVPAVAVDVGGVEEAVANGETGIVVPRSVAAVADALRSVDQDRDLLAQMGDTARRRVATMFALGRAVDRYDLVLRRLLSN